MERPGMSYNEARARINRMINTSKGHPEAKRNYCNSVLNQVNKRDGQGAVKEILKEFGAR